MADLSHDMTTEAILSALHLLFGHLDILNGVCFRTNECVLFSSLMSLAVPESTHNTVNLTQNNCSGYPTWGVNQQVEPLFLSMQFCSEHIRGGSLVLPF